MFHFHSNLEIIHVAESEKFLQYASKLGNRIIYYYYIIILNDTRYRNYFNECYGLSILSRIL